MCTVRLQCTLLAAQSPPAGVAQHQGGIIFSDAKYYLLYGYDILNDKLITVQQHKKSKQCILNRRAQSLYERYYY
jgi:hypothetical protein